MLTVRGAGLCKRFGSTLALDGVDLAIQAGELFTLLGPSGCGKTTLLRLLAGLEEATAGRIYFDERRVDREPVHRRNVGMVFQSYALFPHLNVGENVKYGLKARGGMAGAEVDRQAAEALAMVGLDGYAHRQPGQLSGGQQQRVALARALVTRPALLLMDEPLSNLDARLRVSMRAEVRRLVKEASITTVYVTHDQEEALAISDRIGVMARGRLVQVGTPYEAYHRPRHREVAAFVGSCSFLAGEVTGGLLRVGGVSVPLPALRGGSGAGYRYEGQVSVGIRPQAAAVELGETRPPGSAGMGVALSLEGEVVGESFLGAYTQVEVKLDQGGVLAASSQLRPGSFAIGSRVQLQVARDELLLFAADTGEAVS